MNKQMWQGIEYISISGAGTRGAAYLGLLTAFDEHTDFRQIQSQIKGYAGTSVGSLCSLCLLVGLSTSNLIELISPIISSFENIAPVFDISLMISNFGFDNGNTIKNAIKVVLNKAGLSESITLQQLRSFFDVDFVCVATNLTTMDFEYISHKNFPNLPVVDAIFMSMCVPFLFTPATSPQNDLYVDGVLTMNTPQCFDASKTLCIIINSTLDKYIPNWPAYLNRLFICRTKNQDLLFAKYACKNVLQIQMNALDPESIDLHINQSTVKRLILAGYISGMSYIYPELMDTIEMVLNLVISLHVHYDASNYDEYYKPNFEF